MMRKFLSIPLLESGRQEINLMVVTLHLMWYLVFSLFWKFYTQFTSCLVRLVPIFLFSISTHPRTLKMFREHWVRVSL